jgi:predicted transposase
MSQILTVDCKLEVSPQQVEKLEAVLRAFANCCEYVNNNTDAKLTNQIAVQSLIYKEARAYSGLSAQMTIHAIRRVCANRKTAKHKDKPVKGFTPKSATYDARTFTFKEKDWSVSLTMLKGREKFSLHIGNYQRHLLAGTNPKSAVLAKRFDGTYYLQIHLESETPTPEETDKVLGVDLGRTDICVTSEGDKFSCINLNCQLEIDADLNGAKNIKTLGRLVNLPGGSEIMSCSLQDIVLRATENPA